MWYEYTGQLLIIVSGVIIITVVALPIAMGIAAALLIGIIGSAIASHILGDKK